MTIAGIVRHLQQTQAFDSRVATVELKNGVVISSAVYALAFIRRYLNNDFRSEEFGTWVSYEELQAEMLLVLVKAAQRYLLNGQPNKPFRPYLARCLKTHLWYLHSFRWRHDPIHGYIPTIDDVIEDYESSDGGHDYSYGHLTLRGQVLGALTVEDVALEIDSLLDVKRFLASLSPRQQEIVAYRIEHLDATEQEVLEALGLARTTLWREMERIRGLYISYARTYEPDWLDFLIRLIRV